MRHTRKGEQYFLGMKAHIGVDAESGLVHTVITTPANTADVMEAEHLLHGDERAAYADAGYQGVEKRVGRPGLTRQHQPDPDAVCTVQSVDGTSIAAR